MDKIWNDHDEMSRDLADHFEQLKRYPRGSMYEPGGSRATLGPKLAPAQNEIKPVSTTKEKPDGKYGY